MKFNVLIGAAISLALLTVPALAQTAPVGGGISVDLGNILAWLQPIIQGVDLVGVTAVLGLVLRFLPASLRGVIGALLTPQVEQLLAQAINYGFNMVVEAERGKKLETSTGNSVVDQAVTYAMGHGANWLVNWAGGQAGITQKIVARIEEFSLPSDAPSTSATPAAPVVPAAPLAPAAA